MKALSYSVLVIVAIFFVGCSKNDTPTQTTQTSEPIVYTATDIKGTWEGDALKTTSTTHFLFSCNDTLGLAGTAVNSSGTLTVDGKWQIDSTGSIRYAGYHVYHWNNRVTTIAWGAWYVRLNVRKDSITGFFDLPAIAAFDSATITLVKK